MTISSEFSRVVCLADNPAPKFQISLEANETERAALAKRFSLISLGSYHVDATIILTPGGLVSVRAQMTAHVEQSCIISLAPVHTKIENTFELELVPEPDSGDEETSQSELVIDASEKDCEILTDGCFDLGELSVQYLGLAIDSYPRAKGIGIKDLARAGYPVESEDEAGQKLHPFAALKELKDKT